MRVETLKLPNGAGASKILTSDGSGNATWQTASSAVYLSNYTMSNVTVDRTYNADSTSLDELWDILGTVISDLTTSSALLSGYTVTNGTTLKVYDANNVSLDQLADVLSTIIVDLAADRALTRYRVDNLNIDRKADANSSTIDEFADVLGTLIADLGGGKSAGSTSKYTTTIGDGSTTSFTINHNLSARSVDVIVREAGDDYEEVMPAVKFASDNSILLTFLVAPTTNQYHVTCVAAYDASENFAAGKFVQTIGDGSSTTLTVTHNFNTRDYQVSVYETGSPYTEVQAGVAKTTSNTCALTFDTAPTTNQYTVVLLFGSSNVSYPFKATDMGYDANGLAAGAFSAYRSGAQSATSGDQVTYEAEDFDVSNWFDVATHRYTPLVKGIYRLDWFVAAPVLTADNYIYTVLRKNGSNLKDGSYSFQRGASLSPASTGTSLVAANGTTDYFDVIIVHNQGGTIALPVGSRTVRFSGELVGRQA